LEERLVLGYPYVLESTFLPCRIYNAEEPCLRIDNILGICSVSVLGISNITGYLAYLQLASFRNIMKIAGTAINMSGARLW